MVTFFFVSSYIIFNVSGSHSLLLVKIFSVVFAFVTLRHLEKRVKEEAGEREEYDRGKSEKEVRCGVVY